MSFLATVTLPAVVAAATASAAGASTVLPGSGSVVAPTSGTASLTVPVSLSVASAQTVTVLWNTYPVSGPGRAQAGRDYTAASGTITFTPGQTAHSVSISVNHGSGTAPFAWVVVSFHDPTNASLGGFYGLGFGVILRQPVGLGDLAGSFTGGTGSSVQNSSACPVGLIFYVKFDTSYAGSASVGTVALHFEGCADFSADLFGPGTFTLSTDVGSVSGNATGSVSASLDRQGNLTVGLSLNFRVTSGTGAFAASTGTLIFTSHSPTAEPAAGTVTA